MLAPEEKDSIIEKYTLSFHETAEGISGKIDRNRIVPVLKDNAWLEEMHLAMKARGEGKTPTSVHESYNDDSDEPRITVMRIEVDKERGGNGNLVFIAPRSQV